MPWASADDGHNARLPSADLGVQLLHASLKTRQRDAARCPARGFVLEVLRVSARQLPDVLGLVLDVVRVDA